MLFLCPQSVILSPHYCHTWYNRDLKMTVKKKTVTSVIQEVISGKKYFSVEAVKKSASKIQRGIKPLTVNQYLYNMKKAGDLYDAGKGWYSSIAEAFQVSVKSLDKLELMIHKQYPLLSFSLWRHEQLQPFAHHMMTQFTHFVYVEIDAIPSISDYLREQGYQPYANPQKLEVEKYFHASPKQLSFAHPSLVSRLKVTMQLLKKYWLIYS